MAVTTLVKTVRLSASFRSAAGAKQIDVSVAPDATARNLLDAVARAYPALGERLFDGEGRLHPGIQVLADGRHIDFLLGERTPVADAKDLMLIPPVGGG